MKIHYLNGPQAGRRVELSAEGATIGREQDNQIQLLIGGVSRYHAKIENKDGDWILRDLGSTNGTKINDVLIESPTKLNHGDHVVIGDQQFRIELLAHAPAATVVANTDVDSTSAFPAPEPTSPAFVFRPDVMPPSQPPPPPVSPAAASAPSAAADAKPQNPPPAHTEPAEPEQTLKVNFEEGDIFKSDSSTGNGPAADGKKGKNALIANIIFAVILIVMITVGAILIQKTLHSGENEASQNGGKAANGKKGGPNAAAQQEQDSFFFYYERMIETKDKEKPNIFKVVIEGECKVRAKKDKEPEKYFELNVVLYDLAYGREWKSGPLTDISMDKVEELQKDLNEKFLKAVALQGDALRDESCFDRIVVGLNGELKDVIFYNGRARTSTNFQNAQELVEEFVRRVTGVPLHMTQEECRQEADRAYNQASNAGDYKDSVDSFWNAYEAYKRAELYFQMLNDPRARECKEKKEILEKYKEDKFRNWDRDAERYFREKQYSQAIAVCEEAMAFFREGTKEYKTFRGYEINIRKQQNAKNKK